MLQYACQALLDGDIVSSMEPTATEAQRNDEPLGPARLGRYIERCRLSRGMKQGELAALAEINPSYLSTVEAGQRNWPQTVMPKIAAALGIHEAFFAYEAGVIAEDPALIATPSAIRPDDPRAEIVRCLPDISDDDLPAVQVVVERLAKRRKG